MVDLDNIKKYMINLDRREDRREWMKSELDYIGWTDVERFSAIDTNSSAGCGLSHVELAKKAKSDGLPHVMIIEDDLLFMPWAKSMLQHAVDEFNKTDAVLLHLGPSLHRTLKNYNSVLTDLTNKPPKTHVNMRGVFGTSGFIYKSDIYDLITDWKPETLIAIDEWFDKKIYNNHQSFAPVFPIVTQRPDYSDINKTIDQNHYILSYNWFSHTPNKLPTKFTSYEYCMKFREKEGHVSYQQYTQHINN